MAGRLSDEELLEELTSRGISQETMNLVVQDQLRQAATTPGRDQPLGPSITQQQAPVPVEQTTLGKLFNALINEPADIIERLANEFRQGRTAPATEEPDNRERVAGR